MRPAYHSNPSQTKVMRMSTTIVNQSVGRVRNRLKVASANKPKVIMKPPQKCITLSNHQRYQYKDSDIAAAWTAANTAERRTKTITIGCNIVLIVPSASTKKHLTKRCCFLEPQTHAPDINQVGALSELGLKFLAEPHSSSRLQAALMLSIEEHT